MIRDSKSAFNAFMNLVPLNCCVVLEGCNVGDGFEGAYYDKQFEKFYPDHDVQLGKGTCVVLPTGDSFRTPGKLKKKNAVKSFWKSIWKFFKTPPAGNPSFQYPLI